MSDRHSGSVGKRYEVLGVLGSGGMGVVYAAVDRLQNRQVAVKRVQLPAAKGARSEKASDQQDAVAPTAADITGLPTIAGNLTEGGTSLEQPVIVVERSWLSQDSLQALRLALANEFRTLAALRHPNIVSVLDYGFAPDGHPYFTMELLTGGQSLHAVTAGRTMATKVSLLLQILQALSYLHRRGVLHCDLKPANVVCIDTPAGPRVKLLDFGLAVLQRRRHAGSHEIAGTMGYIAPEVLLGQPVTPQADLYSFGVVAFELLSGRALWPVELLSGLLTVATTYDPPVEDADLPASLLAILRRLLHRQPAARFATADEVAKALAAAAGVPLSAETSELRDCSLGTAELVGRDGELAVLTAALHKALQGCGQMMLLAGESGSGKSRLVEELRTLAMIQGACVLSGQARSDGNADVVLFADALRRLCLDVPPPAPTASVLKGIISELPTLVGCDLSDPPELDAQAARLRLMAAVTSILLGVQQPAVLLLEDLQWAGPDSIEILRHIAAQLSDKPLLVVGTYRIEERPGLPEELRGSQVVRLERLQRDDIARLSASILGEGRASARFLDWLTAQSEGNSFFITEVMRAVAEEAGSLDSISEAPLPQGLLTGGMNAVLRRRIEQVPQWARPLLQLAAIAGRQLSLETLRTFAAELEDWLRVCAAAGVLEVHEPSWRFSHDKLRERLLADMLPAEQAQLHLQIADAIERGSGERGDLAAQLAFHYQQAGALAKAASYSALAGESAFRRGALAEALSLLQQARSLQDQLPVQSLDKARTERLLAETWYGLSRYKEGLQAVTQALSFLGRPVPTGQQQQQRAILTQTFAQLLHWVHTPAPSPPASSDEARLLMEEAWLHVLHADLSAFLGQMEGLCYSIMYLANVGDKHRDLARTFPFYQGLHLLLALMPLRLPSGHVRELQESMLPALSDARTRLMVMRNGGVCYHYLGEQQAAATLLEQTLQLADELCDATTQRMMLSYLVRTTIYLGQYDAALRYAERLCVVERPRGDPVWQQLTNMSLASAYMSRGELSKADAWLAQSVSAAHHDLTHFVSAMQALNLSRMGRSEEARQHLMACLPGFEQTPINVVLGVQSYSPPAQAALLLCQRASTPSEQRTSQALYRRAVRILLRFTMMSRHGRPILWLLQGCTAWSAGHTRLAAWLFRRAYKDASSIQMWPTAALASCWLGRAQAGDAGNLLIQEGLGRLRSYGAKWEVEQIEGWPPSR